MKIRQVGAELFDADGRTLTLLVVVCCSFVDAPEMAYCLMNSLVQTHCFCVHQPPNPPPFFHVISTLRALCLSSIMGADKTEPVLLNRQTNTCTILISYLFIKTYL